MTSLIQACYKLVDNLVTSLLQGCHKVVTRLSQGCHKVVTRLSVPWVSRCYKLVTRLSQGCHKQGCQYPGYDRFLVLQACYMLVTRLSTLNLLLEKCTECDDIFTVMKFSLGS